MIFTRTFCLIVSVALAIVWGFWFMLTRETSNVFTQATQAAFYTLPAVILTTSMVLQVLTIAVLEWWERYHR